METEWQIGKRSKKSKEALERKGYLQKEIKGLISAVQEQRSNKEHWQTTHFRKTQNIPVKRGVESIT